MSLSSTNPAELGLGSSEPSLPPTRSSQVPSAADWIRLKPVIKRLYIDEGRTLKDVMRIMADEHGHRATVKMYKSRLNSYGLNKHNKASDMAFIVRTQRRRERQGKKSNFIVYNKMVNRMDIDRYIQRKGYLGLGVNEAPADAPTPDHIQCLSVPSTPSVLATEEIFQLDQQDGIRFATAASGRRNTSKKNLTVQLSRKFLNISNPIKTPQTHHALQSTSFPVTVTPPEIFSNNEMLFKAISNYVSGSVDSRAWVFEGEITISPSPDVLRFANSCTAASNFFANSRWVEGRLLISQAFAFIPRVLRDSNPSTLELILAAYLGMEDQLDPHLCIMLLNHVRQMAGIILPKGHIWRIICTLISCPETCGKELWHRSWQCLLDCLRRTALKDSPFTVETEANFVLWTTYDDAASSERHLKLLRARYKFSSFRRVETEIYIVECLATILSFQDKYQEAEILIKDTIATARDSIVPDPLYESRLHKMLASLHYVQKKFHDARITLWRSISMATSVIGWDDPTVIDSCAVLEYWLHEAGHAQEADEVRERYMSMVHAQGDEEFDYINEG